MSNAEVAIKAAKDLNADSLVPELFRAANEAFYRAKRDFRTKEFDSARKNALRATRLAEQAEFEAYRLGGATPEASNHLDSPEGAFPDADAAFRDSPDLQTPPEENSDQTQNNESSAQPPKPEKGIDYNEYLREKEAEEAAQKEKEKEKKSEKPAGAQGPKTPTPSVPDKSAPQTGAIPPITSANPGLSGYSPPQRSLMPKAGSPKPQSFYQGAKPVTPSVDEIEKDNIDKTSDEPVSQLSDDGLDAKPLNNIEAEPVSEFKDDKEDTNK